MTNFSNMLAAVFFAAGLTFAVGISNESIAADKHEDHSGHDHKGEHGHKAGHSHKEEHGHHAKHGGQLIELGDHQAVEMVVRGTEISFYVSEDDKPADLAGGTFRLFVQNGSDVMSSALTIKGNRLIAKLAKPVASGAKVVLTGKDGHGHVLQARFVRK